jgi:SNF2 family DNA or RNA helicase
MQRHTLFPWQRTALRQIRGQPRIALFMEMRLGKTPVAIHWIRDLMAQQQTAFRTMVIAPMSVLDDWQEELLREGISARRIIRLDGLTQGDRAEQAYAGPGWYLINYEGVRINDDMAEMPWDAIICDESTSIRNPQAAITKRLTREYQHVPYRAILTGDPVPEGPMNYFSQFVFLHGSFLGLTNFWVFRHKKFKQDPRYDWLWTPKPGIRDEIKTYVHERAVVMTRQQYKVGGVKSYQTRVVPMNDAQKRAYKEIATKFQFEYIETNFATVRDVWLARIAGGFSPDKENPEQLSNAKIQEIIKLKQGELKHQAVVIWFRFNEELWATVAALKKAKIMAVGVDGSVKKEDRYGIRDRFMKGAFDVICVQVRLGRFGWNLSRATTAIYYSYPYDRESLAQSEDRIVHPTRKDPLLYINLVTQGSIDKEVVQLQREKKLTSRAFMRRLNSAVMADLQRRANENQTQKRTRTPTQKIRVRRTYPGDRRTD